MAGSSELNFIRQQGFRDAGAEACGYQFPALMFQPKVMALLVLAGVVLQSWQLFIGLFAVLVWNVVLPSLNIFDALYNTCIARPKGLPRLGPAPGPPRFAQAMAASFALGIAISLYSGWFVAAWIIEGLLLVALSALIFGKFCFGSYVFHLLRKDREFAHRTLPWSRDPK